MIEAAAPDESTPRPFLVAFGPVVAAILGVSLWVQLASFTVRADVAVSALSRGLALALPLGALVAGVALRSTVGVLALFPLTLLPPLLLTPDGAMASFSDPWSAGRVCASLALYLSLSSAWLSHLDCPPASEGTEPTQGVATEVRRHVLPRVIPLLAAWAVPTYAIFWDPAIVSTIEQSYGDGGRVAQLFASVALFFGWAVIAYTWFIVPSLNLEYDRRQFMRDADALSRIEASDVMRRLIVTIVVTVTLTALLLIVI